MTNRDELNAMSNAEFGAWIAQILDGASTYKVPCYGCPAGGFCTRSAGAQEGRFVKYRRCSEVIADWLRAEAE